MTNLRAEIIGLKELDIKFDHLGAVGRGKVLEAALVAGALIINNAAKRYAPWLTGTLRRSIHVGGHVTESEDDFRRVDIGGNYDDVGGNEVKDNNVSVLIGTNLEYARKIEYGGSKKAPNGYLRRAFDENIENVKETIGEAIKVLIEQAAK